MRPSFAAISPFHLAGWLPLLLLLLPLPLLLLPLFLLFFLPYLHARSCCFSPAPPGMPQEQLFILNMAVANRKFGHRVWSPSGELQCEYWVESSDEIGGVDRLNVTAGSLQRLYTNNRSDATVDKPAASTSDLILALAGGAPRKSGWKSPFAGLIRQSHQQQRKRPPRHQHPTTSLSSDTDTASSSRNNSPTTTPRGTMSVDTELKSQRRVSAISSSPSANGSKKSPSFFKRLSTHRRNQSSVHNATTNGTNSSSDIEPPSPQQPAPSRQPPPAPAPTQKTDLPSLPKSALRPALVNGQSRQKSTEQVPQFSNAIANGSGDVMYPDGLPTPLGSPKGTSTKGIKWASNAVSDPPTRPRRTSSAATHGRRSSIYSKAAEGDYYYQGVDAGVGSKARRLSVHLPEEMMVDACRLEEHFSLHHRLHTKEIGEGGAAVVKLMKSKTASGEPKGKGKGVYAVKEFRPREPEEEDEHEYERKIKSEYAISKSLKNPNIVETFQLCQDRSSRWFHVMEYCELGDLNDLISKNYFSRADQHCMFKQLVRGIHHLHERGIAHRDIKSENLLVDAKGCLKIADFGTAEVFAGPHPGARNCAKQELVDPDEDIRLCQPGWVGSKPYMAPEVLQRLGEYDPRAVDVWSAGIVYLTLIFRGNPWDAANPEVSKNYNIYVASWDEWEERHPNKEIEPSWAKKKGRLPGAEWQEVPTGAILPDFASKSRWKDLDDKGLICGMLDPNPKRRWTMKQVLDSAMVTKSECCQQEGYSEDLKNRQKKALHNHIPPDRRKEFAKK